MQTIRGIALVGEPGSGKSTIAAALCDILAWEKRSFAGPLKDEVAHALASVNPQEFRVGSRALTYEQRVRQEMDDPATKDRYRTLLQWWGTEYRRAEDANYWIKQFEKSVSFGATGGHFVVDDLRFDNEYAILVRYGFKLVRLESGETTRPVQEHASEVDWKSWEPDLTLSYEKGPEHQAQRVIEALELV